MWFDDDDDDDDDDKGECGEDEQQPLVPQAKSSRRRREDQKDPDFQVKPRSPVQVLTVQPQVCGWACGCSLLLAC